MTSYEPFLADSDEPRFDDTDALRRHRMRRAALAYRLFGAYHWGEQGDGHISARDPERTDCFWLLRYGVPFGAATVSDLVLVGPGGAIVDANGNADPTINITAYNIHWPIHEARPEIVCAAHTHTPYGTPWSANAEPFQQIVQEATAFFERHSVYDGEDVNVQSTDGGKRIAVALGEGHGVILRNHGLLTVGGIDRRGDRLVHHDGARRRGARQGAPPATDQRRSRPHECERDGAARDGMARLQLGVPRARARPERRRLNRVYLA